MAKYKYFLFSDTHGCYDFFISSLENAEFDINDPTHILVGAGDYFDRGSQSDKIYTFLKSRKLKGRIYLVNGNHDDMLRKFLQGLDDGFFNCVYNGTDETIESFSKVTFSLNMLQLDPNFYVDKINKRYPTLLKWLSTNLKPGFQIDNYKITHAGLKNIAQDDQTEPNWIIDNWTKTPYFIRDYPEDGYIHVFGHWHAYQLRKIFGSEVNNETFVYKNFIGLDACTNLSEFVNIYTIESDNLPTVLQ